MWQCIHQYGITCDRGGQAVGKVKVKLPRDMVKVKVPQLHHACM